MKKMLRDWLLTVGVRQNKKKHMTSEKSSFVEHDDSSCQHDNRQDDYHVICSLQTTYHVNVFMNMISRLDDMQYMNMLT